MTRDEYRDPSPVPTVLLFVSAVVFLVGACVLWFAR